jgi:Putative MetA-pathway of phenol degradation
MQSVFWFTHDTMRSPTWEPTFYVEKQLTKPWDVFAEYVGDYPKRGGPVQIAHFGTAFKITPLHQVDFHFGFGLSHAAPERFIGVGYSFRFDELWK